MNKQQIIATVRSDPRIAQAVDAAEQQLGDIELPPHGIAALIDMLESALQDPQSYGEIRQQAVSSGMLDPEDLPEEFNPVILISMLAVLYRFQERGAAPQEGQRPEFAKGGLAQAAEKLRRAGRYGDTMLAHINPQEAAMLRSMGGSGTVNPRTGLPEFFSLKSLVKAVVPVATMFVAPYLAPMVGGSTLAAGALAGGLGSALTGGNPLQGALMGGLGQGLGGMVGGYLAPSLSSSAQGILGNALVGGLGAAATDGNPLQGALMSGLGTYAGQSLQGMGGALGAGLGAAGSQFGNMLAAGYRPGEALAGAGLTGLAAGLQMGARPSQAAVESARTGSTGQGLKYSLAGGTPAGFESGDLGSGVQPGGGVGLKAPVAPTTMPGSSPSWLNPQTLMAGASLLGGLSSAPPQVQQAVSSMSPEQREYFNRPNISWDWNSLQRDATAAGQSLSEYLARNWNSVTSGRYNQTPQQREPQTKMARGGALSQVAYLARGAGSGRADTIDARLSDGEYVIDAETVALLGDGSTDAGARRLDAMRKQVRMHKGKALARGRFSSDAKSPLSYLKEAR